MRERMRTIGALGCAVLCTVILPVSAAYARCSFHQRTGCFDLDSPFQNPFIETLSVSILSDDTMTGFFNLGDACESGPGRCRRTPPGVRWVGTLDNCANVGTVELRARLRGRYLHRRIRGVLTIDGEPRPFSAREVECDR